MNYILQMTVIITFLLLLFTCTSQLKLDRQEEEPDHDANEPDKIPYELQIETYQGKAQGGRLYQFYKKFNKLKPKKEIGLPVGHYYIGNGFRNDILIPETGQKVRLMLHLNGQASVTVIKGEAEIDGTTYHADRSSMIPLIDEDNVTSEISTGSCSINIWKKH